MLILKILSSFITAGLLLCNVFAEDNPENLQLFILAGQSNMSGRGKITPKDQKAYPGLWAFNRDCKWTPAVDPLHFDSRKCGVGPGRSFGIELLKAKPDWQVGLIPCAVGGTPIDVWSKDKFFKKDKIYPYNNLVERVRAAMRSGTLRGILWIQGETDSITKFQAGKHRKGLVRFVKDLRKDLKAPELPVFIGQIPAIERIAVKDVIWAQKKAVGDLPCCYFVPCPENLNLMKDGIHIDAESAKKFGRLFAENYLKQFPKLKAYKNSFPEGQSSSQSKEMDSPKLKSKVVQMKNFCPSGRKPRFIGLLGKNSWSMPKSKMWDKFFPEAIKNNFSAEMCNIQNIDKRLAFCMQNSISVSFRTRSVWPREQVKLIPLEFIESMLKKYPVIQSLGVNEFMNARFTKEERDYIIKLLELCHRYDKYFLWVDASCGALPFMRISSDTKLRRAFAKHRDRIIVIQEAVSGVLQSLNTSVLLGHFLAGNIDHWGINPQFYYWKNSGFLGLNERNYSRKGSREMMPPAVYSQIMMYCAMAGATTFFMGGERVPHYFDKDFEPTETWKATWPFIEELLSGRVIPTREEVAAGIRVYIKGDEHELWHVSSKYARTGKYSIFAAGGLVKAGWYRESWLPIENNQKYVFSGYIRPEKIFPGSYPSVQVLCFNRKAKNVWPLVDVKNLPFKGLTPGKWNRFEVRFQAPAKTTDVVLSVRLDGKPGMGAWFFDDFSLKNASGDEMLKNGSFEQLDTNDTGTEPVEWTLFFKKDDAILKDFGTIGKFYDLADRLSGVGDFFSDTGKYGYIPVMPQNYDTAAGKLKAKYINIYPWNAERVKKELSLVKTGGSACARAVYDKRLWLSSSLENSSGIQQASGTTSQYRIDAELPSSSHLLLVDYSNEISHLLVSGRKIFTTAVTVTGKQPFVVKEGASSTAAQKTGSDYVVKLNIKHDKTITHKFILERK